MLHCALFTLFTLIFFASEQGIENTTLSSKGFELPVHPVHPVHPQKRTF
jgi:hypothetical protein